MSHISELYVYRFGGNPPACEEGKQIYQLPIAFFIKRADGLMSWRGVEQTPPAGKFAGIGYIGFVGNDDGFGGWADEWPLNAEPVCVEVDAHMFERWDGIQWDEHNVDWWEIDDNGLMAAQYCHT